MTYHTYVRTIFSFQINTSTLVTFNELLCVATSEMSVARNSKVSGQKVDIVDCKESVRIPYSLRTCKPTYRMNYLRPLCRTIVQSHDLIFKVVSIGRFVHA